MPIVQPAQPRHTTNELGDRLQIVIPSRKQWLIILFSGAMLVVAVLFEILIIGLLIGSFLRGKVQVPMIFLLSWIIFWTAMCALYVYAFFWQVAGKEIVEVSTQSIILRKAVLGFSIPKVYLAEHVQDLRLSPSMSASEFHRWPYALSWWGIGGGVMGFDYGAKTIKFGNGIDEAEAKQILSEIQQRFPQYRSPGDLTGLQDL